jgi:two-component system, NarL family, nitrate/nitrite response regulator NarL
MRILLADDHTIVREAVGAFLTRIGGDIAIVEAATLEQAVERAGEKGPFDLVMLDYNMPGMNGLAGLDVMRGTIGTVPIAIFSGQITADEAAQALKRGANGIILKDVRGTALISALRLIAAGETYIPHSLIAALQSNGAHAPNSQDGQMRAHLGNLTRREMQSVQQLCRGISNREIGAALELSEITVKLHLHSAFKKMGARNRSDAVRIAMLKGLTAL